MLFGDYMIDLAAIVRVIFVDQALLTEAICT